MRRVPSREFEARCLQIVDDVQKRRIPIVITKDGRSIAMLVPVAQPRADVFGCMTGTARIVGDIEAPTW